MFVNKRKKQLKPMFGGLGQPCIKKASDMGYGCKDGLVCDMITKTCMAPIKEKFLETQGTLVIASTLEDQDEDPVEF